jgi:hypothetical protein
MTYYPKTFLGMLTLLANRILYILWNILCIATAANFIICLLSYNNVFGAILSIIMMWVLPRMYLYGLNYLDFENSAKMFDFDD